MADKYRKSSWLKQQTLAGNTNMKLGVDNDVNTEIKSGAAPNGRRSLKN